MKTLDEWLETIPEDEKDKIALPEVWNAAVEATMAVMDRRLAKVEFQLHSTSAHDAKVSVCFVDLVSRKTILESGPWHVLHGNVITVPEPIVLQVGAAE